MPEGMDDEWAAFVQAEIAKAYVGKVILPSELVGYLVDQGYRAATGVWIPALAPLSLALDRGAVIQYSPENRADVAVATAFGYTLAGIRPVILLPEAAISACTNPLTALFITHRAPGLLLIWRDEASLTADIAPRLLEAIGIRHRSPRPETLLQDLVWATGAQDDNDVPTALILQPGVIG